MHRWFGSASDSDKQAAERNNRAARRTINSLPVINSDSDDDYRDCDLSKSFIANVDGADSLDGSSSEEDPPVMAKFEDENGVDDTDYYKKLASVSKRTFNSKEVSFWFTSFETSLKHIGVKSQWAKREVLHSLLPEDVEIAVKHILKKGQDTAGATPYKTLKLELLKRYTPKPEAAFERALARELTSTPSNLAKSIIDDICVCAEPLTSPCCQMVVWGMWSRKLPPELQQRFAGQTFNQDTYESMLELADAFYERLKSHTSIPVASAKAAAAKPSLDETQPAIPYAVNAATRGQGRGGRGGQNRQNGGRGSGRGYSNRGSRGGGGNNNGQKPKWPTPRHEDLPSDNKDYCFNHHTHGRQAFFCSDPLTCVWANIPPHPRPKSVSK